MKYRAKAQVNWDWNKAPAMTAGLPRPKTRHRVLIADDDSILARRLSDYLWQHGFEAKTTKSISEAKELVEFWQPDSIFIDLLLPETSAISLLKFIKTRNIKKTPKVIVMSKQAMPKSIEQVRKAGAEHYLVKPFPFAEAFRVIDPTESKERRREQKKERPLVQGPSTIKELHLINLFLKQATQGSANEANLYNLMRMINLKVKGIRTSLIHCVDADSAYVLASNDDERVQGLRLDLKNYPELAEVRKLASPVVIPNVRQSDLLAPVQSRITQTPFETLVLFPVFRYGRFFGALSVRLEQKDPLEIFYIEKFGQVCSQIISLAIASPDQSLV